MRDKPQGLTPTKAMMRSTLLNREVSMRKQVGDAESAVHEVNINTSDGTSEL